MLSYDAFRIHSRLRRVIVIGTSCCGKTKFAKQLAKQLNYLHIELDSLYWLPNWIARTDNEFRQMVEQASSGDCWVIDGNYGTVRDVIWPRANAVVWLNYNFRTVCSRALLRTFRRSLTGEELYSGNRESLVRAFFTRESILWWVVSTYHRRSREFRELRAGKAFSHVEWIEFREPVEAERFLDTLDLGSGRC